MATQGLPVSNGASVISVKEGSPIKDGKAPQESKKRFTNFRQCESGFTTLVFGHAGKAKVLHYDLSALVRKGAFHTVFTTKASIFTMDASFGKSQMLYMFWFVGCSACAYLFIPEDNLSGMQEFEKFTNYWNVFIPFILGLYISLNIGRWWTLRTQGVGEVLDAAQNVILLLNGMFPGVGWEEVHDQVLKYSLASISLITSACRGHEDVQSLGPQGDDLLTQEELEILNDIPYRARPVLMWTWVLMLTSRVTEDYNINSGKFRDIALQCTKARNGISTIHTYLRTQLPFAYVHLVTFMVNLNNFFVAIKCGFLFALAIKEGQTGRAINQFFFVCIVPPLYQGLLTISFIIHDPFGEDLLDFPIMAFQEYINEAASSMTTMGCRCPALASQQWSQIMATSKEYFACKSGNGGGFNKSDEPAPAPVTTINDTSVDDLFKETVAKMERAMTGQLDAKDEIVAALRDRIKWLESSLSGMKANVAELEAKLAESASLPAPPPPGGGCCSTIQKGESAGRPVIMVPGSSAPPAPEPFAKQPS